MNLNGKTTWIVTYDITDPKRLAVVYRGGEAISSLGRPRSS